MNLDIFFEKIVSQFYPIFYMFFSFSTYAHL